MARLEQLKPGVRVCGVGIMSTAVEIVAVTEYQSAITMIYKTDDGKLDSQLMYPSDLESISIAKSGLPWSFDADADKLRLASEAYRIRLAHIFDPYLAVHTSTVDPLPHQITAVYQEMLPRLPLRYVLADDPGAGKTIMTGLLIKELMARGSLRRCLIVPPGNLAEQWQDELRDKFGLTFKIITNAELEAAAGGNVFLEEDLCILRLDKLARDENVQAKLRMSRWDLVVCDEAHKMSATAWGNEIKYTKRYRAGELLSSLTDHFLLLTATPHNGKNADFQLFMALIDPDRFEGARRNSSLSFDVSDVMRRLVKEDLLKFDGTPLFPERRAYTVNYELSPAEKALYEDVTSYVREEYNRADNLDKPRRNTVGFALTGLQRRLASSPEAIYQSLRRRRERLERRVEEEKQGRQEREDAWDAFSYLDEDAYDPDDYPAAELEEDEEEVIDRATAARSIAELEAEIATLERLEKMANEVRHSGEDCKWSQLAEILKDKEHMFGKDGRREKLIIFTEHRDTLRYLRGQITTLLGDADAVATIHGGIGREERRNVEESFRQDPDVRILIATDAAGEGINLQRAHLMVNYDLPWNPNRLEQRFGRIHRIGQTEVCHLWNLVAKETREGAVYNRLLEKVSVQNEALKGRVFDVLGKVTFENESLRDLMIKAIRYNNSKEVEERLFEVVDASLDKDNLLSLLDEHALTQDAMSIEQVMAVREDMERMEARRLQPHFIQEFFDAAFTDAGGKMKRREEGRYEISRVPHEIRDRHLGRGSRVLERYERICFDKKYCSVPGKPVADLIAPGHPLLDALIDLVRERNADTLTRGAIFVDDTNDGMDASLLFYVEDSIQDGTILTNGTRRIISKNLHFLQMKENGETQDGGPAPYLDYRAPSPEELPVLREYLGAQAWLSENVEGKVTNYAISQVIPAHVAEVQARTRKHIEKARAEVTARLTAEINHWSFEAMRLQEEEGAGKGQDRLNSANAKQRADELEARLRQRMAQLDQEERTSALPPVIVSGAVVFPKGLVDYLMGRPGLGSADVEARRKVEMTAMDAVMAIERSLGYEPIDVSSQNKGYDIESRIPPDLTGKEGHVLRFIEVKGRAEGARTVTATRNEILTALNTPDQFILACVEVNGANTRTTYLKRPFHNPPDPTSNGVIFDLANLKKAAECVLER